MNDKKLLWEQVLQSTEKRLAYHQEHWSQGNSEIKRLFSMVTKIRASIKGGTMPSLFDEHDVASTTCLPEETAAYLMREFHAAIQKTLVKKPYKEAQIELLTNIFQEESKIALREQLSSYHLRLHQQHAIYNVHHAITEGGKKKILVQMATGTGKTVLFAFFPEIIAKKGKVLFLSHRDNLFEQTAQKLQAIHPEKSVQIEANSKTSNNDVDLLVGSVMTLGRKDVSSNARSDKEIEQIFFNDSNMTYRRDSSEYVDRLKQLDPNDFSLIVVDEAHHSTAETYQRIFDYFFSVNKDIILVGVTATPMRTDNEQLEKVYEILAYSLSLREAIERKILSEIECFRINTGVSLDEIHSNSGDFDVDNLSKSINTPERNQLVMQKMAQYGLKEDGTLKKTMIFASNVQHSLELARLGNEMGWKGAHIDAKTPSDVRDKALLDLKNGDLDFITNCGVFTEGTDIEELEQVVLARPTKSPILYEQMLGRGTRRIEGKKEVMTLLDFVDATKFHKVVDVSQIFGQSSPLPDGLVTQQVKEREESAVKSIDIQQHSHNEREDDQHYKLFQSIPELKQSNIHFVGDHEYARVYVSGGRFIELVRTPVMNAWKCYFKYLGHVPGLAIGEEGERLYPTVSDAIDDISHILQTHFQEDKIFWNRKLHSSINQDAPTVKQIRILAKRLKNREYMAQLVAQYPHMAYLLPQLKKVLTGYTKKISSDTEVKTNQQGQMYSLEVFTPEYQQAFIEIGFTRALAMQLIGFVFNQEKLVREQERKEYEVRAQLIQKIYDFETFLSLEEKHGFPNIGHVCNFDPESLPNFQQIYQLDVEVLEQVLQILEEKQYCTNIEYMNFFNKSSSIYDSLESVRSKVQVLEEQIYQNVNLRKLDLQQYYQELLLLENEGKFDDLLEHIKRDYTQSIKIYNKNWPTYGIDLAEISLHNKENYEKLAKLYDNFEKNDMAKDDEYEDFRSMIQQAEKYELLSSIEAQRYVAEADGIQYDISTGRTKKILLTNARISEIKRIIYSPSRRHIEKSKQTELTERFRRYAYRVVCTARDYGVISSEDSKQYTVVIFTKNATYQEVHKVFSAAFDKLKAAGLHSLVKGKST